MKDDRGAERDGDLLLAGSSAGSAKSRHGGSVYDLLVAEIKVECIRQTPLDSLLLPRTNLSGGDDSKANSGHHEVMLMQCVKLLLGDTCL